VINSEADKRTAQDDPLLAAVGKIQRTKREESNMSKRDLSPDSLEAQADALLAAADSMDIPDEIPMPGKQPSGKAAKAARPEADHIMTDEEAKKAGIVRLDDKQVAALPAASWLMGQEKLRELLARGKKKGKLDSGELMEAVDDLNLESDQMDQLYDSLEARTIDIGTGGGPPPRAARR